MTGQRVELWIGNELLAIPNISESVPAGLSEDDNVEIRRWEFGDFAQTSLGNRRNWVF